METITNPVSFFYNTDYLKSALDRNYLNESCAKLSEEEINTLLLKKIPYLHQILACKELLDLITVNNGMIRMLAYACSKETIGVFPIRSARGYALYTDPVGVGKTFTTIMLSAYIAKFKNKLDLNRFEDKKELNIKNFMEAYDLCIRDLKKVFPQPLTPFSILEDELKRRNKRTPKEVEEEDVAVEEFPVPEYKHELLMGNIYKVIELIDEIDNFVKENLDHINDVINSKDFNKIMIMQSKIHILCSNVINKMRKLIGDTELYPYWKNEVFRKFFKYHMHAFKKALSHINAFLTIDGYVNKGSPIDKTLIIVPDGLLNQWKNEFKATCPSLKVLTMDNEENEKRFINFRTSNEYGFIEKTDEWFLTNEYEVFVIGSKFWSDNFNIIERAQFQLIIVDEIDSITLPPKLGEILKVPEDDEGDIDEMRHDVAGGFNWIFITGTPMNLKGRREALFMWLEFFDSLECLVSSFVQCDRKLIQDDLNLPPPKITKKYCATPSNILILNGLLPNEILQRMHAGNTKGAIELIGGTSQENIIKVVQDEIKKRINKLSELIDENEKTLISKESYKYDANFSYADGSYDILKKKTEQLKGNRDILLSHLKVIISRIKESKDVCQICCTDYNDIQTKCLLKCCQKIMCLECITSLMKFRNSCTNCLTNFNADSNNELMSLNKFPFVVLTDEEIECKKEISKNTLAIETIFENEGQTLLYINYTENTAELIRDLEQANVSFKSLIDTNITKSEVEQIINLYLNGSIKVLVLCAINYAAGYNLQNTKNIIFLNVMKDYNDQAIGRALRIGQENEINITYILHDCESTDSLNLEQNFNGNYTEWLLNKDNFKVENVKEIKEMDKSYIYESELSDIEPKPDEKEEKDDYAWEGSFLDDYQLKIDTTIYEEKKDDEDDEDDEDDDDEDEDEDEDEDN